MSTSTICGGWARCRIVPPNERKPRANGACECGRLKAPLRSIATTKTLALAFLENQALPHGEVRDG